MNRKRVGIYGASEDSFELARLLTANPDLEIVRFWHADRAAALAQAESISSDLLAAVEHLLTEDLDAFVRGRLEVVIDASAESGVPSFSARFPTATDHGVQVLTPLTARLLFGYGVEGRDRKSELLKALSEIVESVDLTVDSDALFSRMLEIAVGVTGADGGSLMLLDSERQELGVQVAIGLEPELWDKVRVSLGDGIAGRVAADGQALHVRGKADRRTFNIVRERLDVESAICVPLLHGSRVLGVLNLHHYTRADALSESDAEFLQQLAHLDAEIIARAQQHEALRRQAACYDAVREVHRILAEPDPLADRLRRLCGVVAERAGRGIANLYLHDADEGELRLIATSLEGGGFGGEYRVIPGEGIDGGVAQSREPSFLHADGGALAYAALPLVVGERLVGVLSVQAGPEPPGGRAAEEQLLEVAAAIAQDVAQADREARIAARAMRVSAINETGIRMISTTDLAEVTRSATTSAALVLDADHAVLRLQDQETGRYVIRSYYGAADGPQQETLFRLDKQVAVDAIKRRSAVLVRDLGTHERLSAFSPELRTLMAAPLKRDGKVVGTLSIYDKVAADRFYPGRFNDEDLQVFAKLVSYVERAVQNALFHASARQYRHFDDETGAPNASYLSRRIHEEISRAQGREGALVVAVCRIENLEEITREAGPPHAHRVVVRTLDALRGQLRDFDVVGRSSSDTFTLLLPDPGLTPAERVFNLARAASDAVAKDDALNDPRRVSLAFGYAIHPADGADSNALLERAGQARIRMA